MITSRFQRRVLSISVNDETLFDHLSFLFRKGYRFGSVTFFNKFDILKWFFKMNVCFIFIIDTLIYSLTGLL